MRSFINILESDIPAVDPEGILGGHVPGDPNLYRVNAARCLELAERARTPEQHQSLIFIAQMWTGLAAETESDQALLRALSEIEFAKPYESLPLALHLYCGEVQTPLHRD